MPNPLTLPFIVFAAAIAWLVLRSDAARHRHVSPLTWKPDAREARRSIPSPFAAPEASAAPLPLPTSHVHARAARWQRRWQYWPRLDWSRLASRASAHAAGSLRRHTTLLGMSLGVLGAASLVIALAATQGARPTDDGAPAPGSTIAAVAGGPPTAGPAEGATATSSPTLPVLVGAPFSSDRLLAEWAARGLRIESADERLTCLDGPQRTYRAQSAAGGPQVAVVFVYASPAALQQDWATERGSPLRTRRALACPLAGAVTYWNQNVVVVFAQTTDAVVRQQMSDALLRLG